MKKKITRGWSVKKYYALMDGKCYVYSGGSLGQLALFDNEKGAEAWSEMIHTGKKLEVKKVEIKVAHPRGGEK